MKAPALVLVVLFVLSVVVGISNASALSAVSFTTKASITSANQQFQRLYENGTSSIIALDGSATNGTYYKRAYSVAAGTASSSTTTLSGSGNTVNADAFTSPVDLSRYSLDFESSSSQTVRVSDSPSLDFSSGVTLIGRFKFESLGAFDALVRKDGAYALEIGSAGNTIRMTVWIGGIFHAVEGSTVLTPGQWYCLAGRYNGVNDIVYVGGVQDGINSQTGNIDTNANDLYIASLGGGGFYADGLADDFAVYGDLLPSQIQDYCNGNYTTLGLSALWDFNDGVGTSLKDLSGNGNTGTLVNSPAWSSDVASASLSRPTTYITGRDTTTGKNGFAKLNLSDLSKVSDNYQTSSYAPRGIAQSTTKLYSPLYNGTVSTYGTMKLGIIGRDFTSYSEPTIYTGTSAAPAYSVYANVTGSVSGGTYLLSSAYNTVATEKFISTAALIGYTIDGLQLRLNKNNSPTGTATIGTFDSSGNVITTLATFDVSTLTTTMSTITFNFAKPYTIQANDRIGIKYTGGDGSNYVRLDIGSGNIYDGTNAFVSNYSAGWTDTTGQDYLFAVKRATAKVAVIDGSPDTEYVFFETGTSNLGVVKYTSSATTISTSLSHTAGQPYSIIPMSGKILIQTSSATYSLNTSTDAITTLYSTSFNTRYPQAFTISPSVRTYNSNAAYLANSTIAVNYTPSTGGSTSTGVMIQTTTAPTLTAYSPSKYYYLTQNQLVVEASSGSNTWTIKSVGSQNQFHVTPYGEQIGISLMENDTLFSQNVLHLNCDSGVYTVNVKYFATGDDSDCTLWRTTADSSETVGREIFNPYSRTVSPVHAPVYTGYTFNINAGDPTAYYIKSLYDGKVVDVATFDSGSTATQRYLFGQCYDVEVINGNTNQTGLIGNICANDVTTKNINIDTITVPSNWQGTAWEYQLTRSFTNSTNNSVLFTVRSDETPFNANIHVVNNLFQNGTIDQWYNFTDQSNPITLNLNGYLSNNTLWFSVYDDNSLVIRAVSAGKSLDLADFMDSFGPVFGISIMGFFIVIVAGIFPRSMGTIAIVAVLATTGIMWSIGWLDAMPVALWPALIGLAVIGIFSSRRSG